MVSMLNPLKEGFSYKLFNIRERDSAAIMKREGEIGSPCLTPLLDWKKTMSLAINCDGIPIIGKEIPHIMNPSIIKTHSFHNNANKLPGHPVVSFVHVNLEYNISPFILGLDLMNNFLSQKKILSYSSTLNETTLIEGDDLRKNMGGPVIHYFRDNFLSNIAKTDGSEFREGLRRLHFRNENQTSACEVLGHLLSIQHCFDKLSNIFTNYAPSFLEEKPTETIRSTRAIGVNTNNSLFYFLCGRISYQYLIVLLANAIRDEVKQAIIYHIFSFRKQVMVKLYSSNANVIIPLNPIFINFNSMDLIAME